jgi:hypothetical protein
MSIAGTVTALERTNAAYKAAQPVAKRGMFALVERRNSYLSLRDGHHAWTTFTPAVVSSVDRAGIVKAVCLVGQEWPLQRRDWQQISVDSRRQIADLAAVVAALVDENGRGIEYRNPSEALAAIKAAAGLAP